MAKTFFAIVGLVALTACTGGDRGLRSFDTDTPGPDEFTVLPAGPLEIPEDLSALPAPTPGGTNRTDVTPAADAIVALGGNPGVVQAGGVPTSDRALVAQAGRNGVDPSIRATLAAEDETFRNRRGRLSLFRGRDIYFQVYASQALDAYAELSRFRNLGVAVPSAPPSN